MATSTVAVPAARRSGWRLVIKIVFTTVVLALLAAWGAGIWFSRAAHASLAQLDGTITLAGLKAPVQVIRDGHGVPHMTAASLDDLFMAQGYITAQDRLWQMDVTRRAMAGEMAEIFPASSAPNSSASRINGAPPKTRTWVDYDQQQRILRLRAVADHVAAQMPERDRAFFNAYARGVNLYIEQHRDNLPIEFRLLRYSPREWKPADSVLIGVGMSQLLNPQFEMEYKREHTAKLLSPELMADLFPADSPRDHAPADDAPNAATEPKIPAAKTGPPKQPANKTGMNQVPESTQFAALVGDRTLTDRNCEACLPGSNNWVVSGAHTTTGRPLLSNDMHLPHRVPSMWFEAHLHSGDYNIEGFTLPGMPFVIVGHNQRIAWGYTNLNPDVQDLFIENFNAAGEYETPTGWQKPEKFHEVVKVKGSADVEFDVTVTRHGPIISSLLPGESRQIALQWMIYDIRQISIPLFDLNSAQNWEQFRKALSVFSTPSQNVVYADVDGNIGYQPMGFMPVRAAGDGTMPVSGADGKHDWTGYVDFDQLPRVYNPPGGIIATANSKITPKGYPHLLASQWFPPYRAERIYQVLNTGKKFSPADMLALQTDIQSNYDRFFAQQFAAAAGHSSKATDRTRQAAEILGAFDGRMDADSTAPVIETYARRALWEMLLKPKLGDAWQDYEWSEQAVALENIVTAKPARWLPPGTANFDDLLTAAVDKAIKDAPADLKSWKYGEKFPVVINHPLLGIVPGVAGIAGPGRHPQSGGGFTVKQVGQGFGPSERMTVDFSNLDSSTFNIVEGESGQLYSPYYMDHWDAWYNNKTFTLAFSDAAVQGAKAHELTLTPGK